MNRQNATEARNAPVKMADALLKNVDRSKVIGLDEVLRKDEDFILYRGRSQGDGCPILVLSPVAEGCRVQPL
jgi:hypothetical protein